MSQRRQGTAWVRARSKPRARANSRESRHISPPAEARRGSVDPGAKPTAASKGGGRGVRASALDRRSFVAHLGTFRGDARRGRRSTRDGPANRKHHRRTHACRAEERFAGDERPAPHRPRDLGGLQRVGSAGTRARSLGSSRAPLPWPAYELKILQLGRALDIVKRKMGFWRGRGPLLDAVASVIGDLRFGRGRQSFIATLGEHGGAAATAPSWRRCPVGERPRWLRDDRRSMRSGNGEYVDAVVAAASADGERPWVRSAARMYVAAFSGPPSSKSADVEPRRSRRAPAA